MKSLSNLYNRPARLMAEPPISLLLGYYPKKNLLFLRVGSMVGRQAQGMPTNAALPLSRQHSKIPMPC